MLCDGSQETTVQQYAYDVDLQFSGAASSVAASAALGVFAMMRQALMTTLDDLVRRRSLWPISGCPHRASGSTSDLNASGKR